MEVEETTQPNPIEPLAADSPAVLAIALSVLGNVSSPPIATPATSKEELVTLVTISTALMDEPANPPTPLKKLAMQGVPQNWNTRDGWKWIHPIWLPP